MDTVLLIADAALAIVMIVLVIRYLAASNKAAPLNLRVAWVLEGVGAVGIVSALLGTSALVIGNALMIGGIILQCMSDRRIVGYLIAFRSLAVGRTQDETGGRRNYQQKDENEQV